MGSEESTSPSEGVGPSEMTSKMDSNDLSRIDPDDRGRGDEGGDEAICVFLSAFVDLGFGASSTDYLLKQSKRDEELVKMANAYANGEM